MTAPLFHVTLSLKITETGAGGIDWEFEIEHVHPAIVKIDNQQDPTVKKNK